MKREKRGASDEVAVLAGFGCEFALRAEPICEATQNEGNHGQVDGVTRGDEDRLEGPLDKLADGGNEFLEVHEVTLMRRI